MGSPIKSGIDRLRVTADCTTFSDAARTELSGDAHCGLAIERSAHGPATRHGGVASGSRRAIVLLKMMCKISTVFLLGHAGSGRRARRARRRPEHRVCSGRPARVPRARVVPDLGRPRRRRDRAWLHRGHDRRVSARAHADPADRRPARPAAATGDPRAADARAPPASQRLPRDRLRAALQLPAALSPGRERALAGTDEQVLCQEGAGRTRDQIHTEALELTAKFLLDRGVLAGRP